MSCLYELKFKANQEAKAISQEMKHFNTKLTTGHVILGTAHFLDYNSDNS
jgi:hypothetical protein